MLVDVAHSAAAMAKNHPIWRRYWSENAMENANGKMLAKSVAHSLSMKMISAQSAKIIAKVNICSCVKSF